MLGLTEVLKVSATSQLLIPEDLETPRGISRLVWTNPEDTRIIIRTHGHKTNPYSFIEKFATGRVDVQLNPRKTSSPSHGKREDSNLSYRADDKFTRQTQLMPGSGKLHRTANKSTASREFAKRPKHRDLLRPASGQRYGATKETIPSIEGPAR